MIDWINHVPDRIAEAEYGEEGGVYTRLSLHYTKALFTCSWWVVLQCRLSVFVVVAQDRSFNVWCLVVQHRRFHVFVVVVATSVTCRVGFRMLFCCFGDLHTVLPYHTIGHFLCIGCALCKHEFYTLETQKVWLSWVGAVFRLALGLYASWLSFLDFFCVCEIDESTRQLQISKASSLMPSKHIV